jgi:hypothetical protein
MPTRRTVSAALAGLIPAAFARHRPAAAQSAPEILARYPSGTFLENLALEPDGRVLFTSYFARRIESWSAAAGARTHAELPALPVSLTPLGDGRQALATHGAAFTEGPAALRGTGAILLLAPSGAVTARIPLPDAIFPNGALLLAPSLLLLADSALGRLWAIDLAAGTARPWLDDPLLTPVEGRPFPGVNGLKRDGADHLLLSNSARRSLLRLRIANAAPAGPLALHAEMPFGIDDFALAADGTLYAATHAEGIARLARGAAIPTLLPAPGLEGSTAVALAPDGTTLYALGTGGLLEGRRGDAVLARLRLPAS